MADEDHDLLVKNTFLTEQNSKQLSSALDQFIVLGQRVQTVEVEVAALKRQLPDSVAAIRSDLMRALDAAAQYRKDDIRQELAPVHAALASIQENAATRAAAQQRMQQRLLNVGRWILTVVGAALAISVGAYIVRLFGL